VRDKFHVLIVKGESEVAELWEQSLERAGYLVSCVARAGAALQRSQIDRIDAAIIGAKLSDMSGTALAQAIRERWPESHVLLLSAGGAEAAAQLAGDAHLQLLPRVVTAHMLKKRLEQLLSLPEQPHLHYGQSLRSISGNASRLPG